MKPDYKHTDVGVIPEEWVVQSLGALGSFKNGINKAAKDFGHGSPFVNLMDVFGIPRAAPTTDNLGLVNSTPDEQQTYDLRAGDVLFVRSSVKPTGVGLTTLIQTDLPATVFSGFLIRFRDHEALANEFKEYCFLDEGFRRRLIAASTVSANTNINQSALKLLQLGFPPSHEEQRAIAKALSDIDALLSGLDRIVAKKRDLKQAVLQQLFTGKARLPGFHGEWEVKRLGDVIEIRKGQLITRGTLVPGDVPVIAGGKQPAYFHATANRVGRTITISASGANAGYVALHNEPIFASDCSTISESENYCLDFVFYALRWKQQAIYNAQAGGAQPHIHAKDLNPLSFSWPSLSEQTAIASVLSDMDAEISMLEQQLGKTRNIKLAMMQELLTGRIRLPFGEVA
jgi:type I restriction enzyme S subunit